MVTVKSVQEQLKRLNVAHRFFGRAELDELPNILVPNETIHSIVNGFYAGGFATLLATDKRLLLVDKKPFILNIEDIRYDMLSDVKFESVLLEAQISVMVAGRSIRFRSWRQAQLRELANCIQARVLETQADWIMRNERPMAQSSAGANSNFADRQLHPQFNNPTSSRRPAYLLHRAASRLAIKSY